MKIKYTRPPHYFLIKLFFPKADFEKLVCVFGDTIFVKYPIPKYLEAHERAHIKQCRGSRLICLVQFFLFAFSAKFRYNQEVIAYRAEYKYIKENFNEEETEKHLRRMAYILSSLLYGNLVSFEVAKLVIKNYENNQQDN